MMNLMARRRQRFAAQAREFDEPLRGAKTDAEIDALFGDGAAEKRAAAMATISDGYDAVIVAHLEAHAKKPSRAAYMREYRAKRAKRI